MKKKKRKLVLFAYKKNRNSRFFFWKYISSILFFVRRNKLIAKNKLLIRLIFFLNYLNNYSNFSIKNKYRSFLLINQIYKPLSRYKFRECFKKLQGVIFNGNNLFFMNKLKLKNHLLKKNNYFKNLLYNNSKFRISKKRSLFLNIFFNVRPMNSYLTVKYKKTILYKKSTGLLGFIKKDRRLKPANVMLIKDFISFFKKILLYKKYKKLYPFKYIALNIIGMQKYSNILSYHLSKTLRNYYYRIIGKIFKLKLKIKNSLNQIYWKRVKKFVRKYLRNLKRYRKRIRIKNKKKNLSLIY